MIATDGQNITVLQGKCEEGTGVEEGEEEALTQHLSEKKTTSLLSPLSVISPGRRKEAVAGKGLWLETSLSRAAFGRGRPDGAEPCEDAGASKYFLTSEPVRLDSAGPRETCRACVASRGQSDAPRSQNTQSTETVASPTNTNVKTIRIHSTTVSTNITDSSELQTSHDRSVVMGLFIPVTHKNLKIYIWIITVYYHLH